MASKMTLRKVRGDTLSQNNSTACDGEELVVHAAASEAMLRTRSAMWQMLAKNMSDNDNDMRRCGGVSFGLFPALFEHGILSYVNCVFGLLATKTARVHFFVFQNSSHENP